MFEEEEPQSSPTPEEPRDGPITGHPNALHQQEAGIPSLYTLRKTVRRRDGRRLREEEPPLTKPVISIIVCKECYTVFEVEFAQRPTTDELSAAKVKTLENHHCRDATTVALRGIGASA